MGCKNEIWLKSSRNQDLIVKYKKRNIDIHLFRCSCEEFNQRYRFCDSDVSIEFKRFVCAKTCGVCIETTTSSTTTTTTIPTTTTTHKKLYDDSETTTQTITEATTTSVCDDDYEKLAPSGWLYCEKNPPWLSWKMRIDSTSGKLHRK